MFVFSFIVLLLFKITCEREDDSKTDLQKREIGLFDVFPKVKESIFGNKQDNLKSNKQTRENTLHLAIDEDPEFPVYKDNEILLENRDADINNQGKGIKRFLQGAPNQNKFQYGNMERITTPIFSSSELSNAFSFQAIRKKRNFVNRVKFKNPFVSECLAANSDYKDEEKISKNHVLHSVKYKTIEDDPVFPVHKGNEIMLDNQDSQLSVQSNRIKCFLQEAMHRNNHQSKNATKTKPTIFSNSELSDQFSFLAPRRKRNLDHKLKNKSISAAEFLDLNIDFNDEDEISKNYDLHLAKYRPGHQCSPQINTTKKNKTLKPPPTVLFDDYVNDENYITLITKNSTTTDNKENMNNKKNTDVKFSNNNTIMHGKAQHKTMSPLCEHLKNIPTNTPLISNGTVQTSLFSYFKSSIKTTDKNKEMSALSITVHKNLSDSKNVITRSLVSQCERSKPAITSPVKNKYTEEMSTKPTIDNQFTIGRNTSSIKGNPTTEQTTKKLIGELIRKLKNNSIISNKSSTKSYTINLIKQKPEEEKDIKHPPLIQKVFGNAQKTTHKIPSATLNEKECITPKRDKVFPARHRGGDAGNHYFHGKHFYTMCQRTEFNIRTQSNIVKGMTVTQPMKTVTSSVTPQIVRKTEPVKSFITKRKFGHAHENVENTESTNCAVNDIKDILPQIVNKEDLNFILDNKYGTSNIKSNKKLRTYFNFTL